MAVNLSDEVAELVALGAASAAACLGCLSYHHRRAHEKGVGDQAIREALAIGRAVRTSSARQMDRLSDKLAGTAVLSPEAPVTCCDREPVPPDCLADPAPVRPAGARERSPF
jgi:AhpD family alkylhydroperoxidase